MSQGIAPYDFVQQVYYAQEKVILDFWPSDDKYKEVLFEANLVLQELQNSEDWTWLRDRLELGHCGEFSHHEIPEFDLPDWVYKPSTLYNDTLKLYHAGRHGMYNPNAFIEVPFVSAGYNGHHNHKAYNTASRVNAHDGRLKAVCIGNTITFNRLLTPAERATIAVVDVQRRIKEFHICDETCKGIDPSKPIDYTRDDNGKFSNPCSKIERVMLTEIPDPNYVVLQTAARHAEGSPPAQGRITGLQDQAQRILSAMRANDASATDSDYLDWEVPGFIEVV